MICGGLHTVSLLAIAVKSIGYHVYFRLNASWRIKQIWLSQPGWLAVIRGVSAISMAESSAMSAWRQ
jgi:hypothetical protein